MISTLLTIPAPGLSANGKGGSIKDPERHQHPVGLNLRMPIHNSKHLRPCPCIPRESPSYASQRSPWHPSTLLRTHAPSRNQPEWRASIGDDSDLPLRPGGQTLEIQRLRSYSERNCCRCCCLLLSH